MLDITENLLDLEFNKDFESENMYFDDNCYSENYEEPQEKQEFEEFYLYCDLNYQNDSLFTPEGNSTKDKFSGSVFGDCKSETNGSEKSNMVVPFNGETPNMQEFERLIQVDMNLKGANQMVCDALDLFNDDQEKTEKESLIKVKKRKSKEQLKQLEDEFALGREWTKEFMNEFAEKINLVPAQVYKWHWDQI